MICVGGPMDGREVSWQLGERWPYCLNPLMPKGFRRITGTYLRIGRSYVWQGIDQ